jgi:hypothetical protein
MEQEPPKRRPLQWLELVFLCIAASPAVVLFTSGRAQSSEQTFFRSAVFIVGIMGYFVVKFYQGRKRGT